jgi:hypothetical protein
LGSITPIRPGSGLQEPGKLAVLITVQADMLDQHAWLLIQWKLGHFLGGLLQTANIVPPLLLTPEKIDPFELSSLLEDIAGSPGRRRRLGQCMAAAQAAGNQ